MTKNLSRRRGELSVSEAVGVQQEVGLQLLRRRYETVEAPEELDIKPPTNTRHPPRLGLHFLRCFGLIGSRF
ncbi:hypothetical protein EYF80_053508 [Liparis tanakae]|uniref:Uncharacterized protein n=1 Tax=Liparis tanakae TaxID=230148 RepID=A0A4Z2F634_9TELE|nr:hypothetical protein EYF80_053508 [Liparis tanakae]